MKELLKKIALEADIVFSRTAGRARRLYFITAPTYVEMLCTDLVDDKLIANRLNEDDRNDQSDKSSDYGPVHRTVALAYSPSWLATQVADYSQSISCMLSAGARCVNLA